MEAAVAVVHVVVVTLVDQSQRRLMSLMLKWWITLTSQLQPLWMVFQMVVHRLQMVERKLEWMISLE